MAAGARSSHSPRSGRSCSSGSSSSSGSGSGTRAGSWAQALEHPGTYEVRIRGGGGGGVKHRQRRPASLPFVRLAGPFFFNGT
jgi:hypothetical protein